MSIDLRAVIVASLAAVPSGCLTSWPRAFEVDAVVRKHDLQHGDQDKPLGTLACERFCWGGLNQRISHNRIEIKELDRCESEPVEPDAIHVICSGTYVTFHEGRRPLAQLEHDRPSSADAELGATLAELAYLEAASILAFTELAAQLARLGAPVELRERCLAAAEDERRHAAMLGALANQHGATPPKPRVHDRRPPELLELALHNAVEGCVFESFAALLACVRAATAADPVLRAIYCSIAEDELRHGQLAWDIHAWAFTRLDQRERAHVLDQRRRAIATLPAHARALASMPPALQRLQPQTAERLAHEFTDRIAAA